MSARAVTDHDAVLRAIAECEALGHEVFLERYGFVRSKRYEVVHDGEHYDPAAIVAVGHREQHGRVLSPAETKGSSRVLRDLGFMLFDPTPPWREEEMVLALDVYLRHRGERVPRTHRDAVELSETLRRLSTEHARHPRFRNPEGMEQQLGVFLDLDPKSSKRGRGSVSKLHRAIWEEYIDDREALRRRADEIRRSLVGSSRATPMHGQALPSTLRDAPQPRKKVSRDALSSPFDADAVPERPAEAELSRPDPEAQHRANVEHRRLLRELVERLRTTGFTCRSPLQGRKDLRYDLLATRDRLTLLVEVKSLPPAGDDHDQLRWGLGQVLWYRGRWRETCTDPCVAVLYVEREPQDAQTWLAVCNSASVVLSWPDRFGTLIEECSRIAALALGRYS
jgi:hypothetical protein